MALNFGDSTASSAIQENQALGDQTALSQHVQTLAASDNQKAAPSGGWDKFVDITEKGFESAPAGMLHALEHPGKLIENAAISVVTGAGAKTLLPEGGALGTIGALGLGAYFLEQAAVPIYDDYKEGFKAKTMGELDAAGAKLGETLGGTAVNLPICYFGYKLGGKLGENILASPRMARLVKFKTGRLSPINDALTSKLQGGASKVNDGVRAGIAGIGRIFGKGGDQETTEIAPGGPLQGHVETTVDDKTTVGEGSDQAPTTLPQLPEKYAPIKEKFGNVTVPGISRQFLKNLQVDNEGTYYGAGLRYPDIASDPQMKAYLDAHNARTIASINPEVMKTQSALEQQAGGAFGSLPEGWAQKAAPASAIDVTDGGDGSMQFDGNTYNVTDDGAPNRKLTVSDGSGTRTLIPNQDGFEMQQVVPAKVGDATKFAVVGSQDGASVLHVYDENGTHEAQIPLPGYGLLHDVKAGESPSQIQFLYDTPNSPPQALTLDLAANKADFSSLPGYSFDTDKFVTQKIMVPYNDIDGKAQTAPVFVSYPKDMQMNGANNALFEIYGGFDVAPQYLRYMANSAAWMKRGGVAVSPVLPGDGGLGLFNYQEGLQAGIQNNVNAMAAIVEKLHDMGITSPERSGIYGRSNGGMMVAMLLNERSDLFGAAVTESGVDSIIDSPVINPDTGRYWQPEFGNPKDPKQIGWMSKLDGLNNVSPSKSYPPTLVILGTMDGVVNAGNGITYANLRFGLPNNGETTLYSRYGEGHDPTSLTLQTAHLWSHLEGKTS